jgi:phosphate binding protein
MRCRMLVGVAILGWAAAGCAPSPNTASTGGGESSSAMKPVSDGAGHVAGESYLPAGAVLPTAETIEHGMYKPLSRPLFLYVNKASLKRPETVAFLRYYLSVEGRELVGDSGYIRLHESEYEQQVTALEEAAKAAGTQVGANVTGQVVVDGSSTVAPITTAVAEEFSKLHSGVRVPVGTSGTGGGFKKFCHGEIDVCDASRAIKEPEVELCKKNHIEYLELLVGNDGLTVVVNPQNAWVSGLTVEDLKKIWSPDSTVKKWNDINPSFPNVDIKLFGPDTDSGTFDYFTEEICGKKGASRSDYQQSADDNFLVTGVAGDKYALGYFGYAYFVENQAKLKALAIAP